MAKGSPSNLARPWINPVVAKYGFEEGEDLSGWYLRATVSAGLSSALPVPVGVSPVYYLKLPTYKFQTQLSSVNDEIGFELMPRQTETVTWTIPLPPPVRFEASENGDSVTTSLGEGAKMITVFGAGVTSGVSANVTIGWLQETSGVPGLVDLAQTGTLWGKQGATNIIGNAFNPWGGPTQTDIGYLEKWSKGSAPNITVYSTSERAMRELEASGFVKSTSRDGTVTVLTNGEKTYRFYPQSTSTGQPSASVSGGDQTTSKLRFPQ